MKESYYAGKSMGTAMLFSAIRELERTDEVFSSKFLISVVD
jgi:hypothetical protein